MKEIITLAGMEKLLKMRRNNLNPKKKPMDFPENWETLVKEYLKMKEGMMVYHKQEAEKSFHDMRMYRCQNRAYQRALKIAEILGVRRCQ